MAHIQHNTTRDSIIKKNRKQKFTKVGATYFDVLVLNIYGFNDSNLINIIAVEMM